FALFPFFCPSRFRKPVIFPGRALAGLLEVRSDQALVLKAAQERVDRTFRDIDHLGDLVDQLVPIAVLAGKDREDTDFKNAFFELDIHGISDARGMPGPGTAEKVSPDLRRGLAVPGDECRGQMPDLHVSSV